MDHLGTGECGSWLIDEILIKNDFATCLREKKRGIYLRQIGQNYFPEKIKSLEILGIIDNLVLNVFFFVCFSLFFLIESAEKLMRCD